MAKAMDRDAMRAARDDALGRAVRHSPFLREAAAARPDLVDLFLAEGAQAAASAAVAAGADGVFLEFHPDPDKAKCDGPSALPLEAAEPLLRQLKAIRELSV